MEQLTMAVLLVIFVLALWITFVDTGDSYARRHIRRGVRMPLKLAGVVAATTSGAAVSAGATPPAVNVQVSAPTPAGQTVAVASAPAQPDGSTPAGAPAPVTTVANTPEAAATAAVKEYLVSYSRRDSAFPAGYAN